MMIAIVPTPSCVLWPPAEGLYIAIDLLPGRRDVHTERTVLEPEVAIPPEHQHGLSIEPLEGLHIAIDLLPGRGDVHAERTGFEPGVPVGSEH